MTRTVYVCVLCKVKECVLYVTKAKSNKKPLLCQFSDDGRSSNINIHREKEENSYKKEAIKNIYT